MEKFDMKQMHTSHKVIICDQCEGTGIRSWNECTDYHKGDYETYHETCKKCDGTGRIFKTKKWHVIYEAFDPKKQNKNLRRKLK